MKSVFLKLNAKIKFINNNYFKLYQNHTLVNNLRSFYNLQVIQNPLNVYSKCKFDTLKKFDLNVSITLICPTFRCSSIKVVSFVSVLLLFLS